MYNENWKKGLKKFLSLKSKIIYVKVIAYYDSDLGEDLW